MRTAAALAAVALLAGCGGDASRGPVSDWERANQHLLSESVQEAETVPPPPAYPSAENLVPVDVTARNDNRYFVDRTSISVRNGVVRYVLVARAGSVDNVSFEALRCRERESRSYARGAAGGTWIVHPTAWRAIQLTSNPAQAVLHHRLFCPNNVAIASADEGAEALRLGKHPWLQRVENPFLGGDE